METGCTVSSFYIFVQGSSLLVNVAPASGNRLLLPGQVPEQQLNRIELQPKKKKKDDNTPLMGKDNRVAPETSLPEVNVQVRDYDRGCCARNCDTWQKIRNSLRVTIRIY